MEKKYFFRRQFIGTGMLAAAGMALASKTSLASSIFNLKTSINMKQLSTDQEINFSSASAPIKFVQVNGLKIAYKLIGDGEPIIFLNRFRGNLNDWDPGFVDVVAARYKVLLFDAPGIGLSEGTVPASITKMGDDAIAFASALGIKKAAYLGWSMGGAVAQAIAVNYPGATSKIVLCATGPSGSPEFVAANPEFGIHARKEKYEFEDNLFLFFHDSVKSRLACEAYLLRVSKIINKDEDTKKESFMNQGMALGDFKANKEKNYFEALKDIKVPVLIANGKFDPSYPLMNSGLLEREIPESKLIIYPDAGHGFLFQYYTEFAAEVVSFLSA
jgi:pimeloyl-ACP methyl ester carboxylesterase